MTAPATTDSGAGVDRQRRTRRRLALGALLVLIVVTALLTPELTGARMGDQRLTTYSAEPQGARLLYELAARLGWRVERSTSDTIGADARTIIAILNPAQPPAAIEVHRVLERVRAGSALLYVMSGMTPLDDSLPFELTTGGPYVPAAAGTAEAPRPVRGADTLRARRFDSVSSVDSASEADDQASEECTGKSRNGGALPFWGDEGVHLYRLAWKRAPPSDAVVFARAAAETGKDSGIARPAAVGFHLGRGRVVVISDPDQLRNDVLRVCRWGLDVVAVRILEYLAAGTSPPRNRLVFDEYHQGFGAHPGTLRAIVLYLSRTSSGHVLLQCMLGGLVLLLALGPRLVPAYDPERVERRSPLEQVAALARAYARVSATRTATAQLLHGVRRRLERTGRGRAMTSDTVFLDEAARAAPTVSEDITLIKRALTTPVTPRELESVGGALSRLEQTLQTQRR